MVVRFFVYPRSQGDDFASLVTTLQDAQLSWIGSNACLAQCVADAGHEMEACSGLAKNEANRLYNTWWKSTRQSDLGLATAAAL